MKKRIILFTLFIILLLPFISAVNLQIENKDSIGVIIPKINEPAVFNLRIKNLGPTDNFQFYNLLGFNMAPVGTINIAKGETKDVQVIVYPREDLEYRGFYKFEYFNKKRN